MPEVLYLPPDIQDAFRRFMRTMGEGRLAVDGLEEVIDLVRQECGQKIGDALSELFDTIMANDPNS